MELKAVEKIQRAGRCGGAAQKGRGGARQKEEVEASQHEFEAAFVGDVALRLILKNEKGSAVLEEAFEDFLVLVADLGEEVFKVGELFLALAAEFHFVDGFLWNTRGNQGLCVVDVVSRRNKGNSIEKRRHQLLELKRGRKTNVVDHINLNVFARGADADFDNLAIRT